MRELDAGAAGRERGPGLTGTESLGLSRAVGIGRVLQLESGLPYLIASCALLLTLSVLLAARHGTPVVDDAYIAFIYGRNLADGAGLVYASGLRVEGYTDFLWVLLLAGGFKAGVDPELLAQGAGLLSALLLVAAVWWWSQRFSTADPVLRVAAPLLAAMGPLAFWTLGGLETATFALLVFAATAAVASGPWPGRPVVAGLLFFPAALAHPDAVVWFAPAVAFLALTKSPTRIRDTALLMLSFGVPFAIYWLWRWSYFGDLMPNSFYAKSDPSVSQIEEGVKYVVKFSPVYGVLSTALILGAFTLGLYKRPAMNLLLGGVVLWFGYVAWVGGDALLMNRFLVPALAPLAILLQEALSEFLSRTSPEVQAQPSFRPGLLVVAVVLMLGTALTTAIIDPNVDRVRSDGSLDESRVALGKWLKVNAGPTDVVAVNAAGAIPYFAERSAIDMLGINDEYIAHHGEVADSAKPGHRRFAPDYVLDQRPDYIVLSPLVEDGRELAPDPSSAPSVVAMLAEPAFADGYTRIRILALPMHEVVFIRNDHVAELVAAGAVSVVQTGGLSTTTPP